MIIMLSSANYIGDAASPTLSVRFAVCAFTFMQGGMHMLSKSPQHVTQAGHLTHSVCPFKFDLQVETLTTPKYMIGSTSMLQWRVCLMPSGRA